MLERWRERGGREAVCWRDREREGGENQYIQLYVGEMEGERGEKLGDGERDRGRGNILLRKLLDLENHVCRFKVSFFTVSHKVFSL